MAMAASMHEPRLSDVDLDEDGRRLRAARDYEERERYRHLPVHHLEKETELREVNLPPTPTAHRRAINGEHVERHSTDREYPVDEHIKHTTPGHPATVTVTEQHQVIHQQTLQDPTKAKKQKRVGFGGFSGFGRRGQVEPAAEGHDGDHHTETGYGKNGATSTHVYNGQGRLDDYGKPTTLTVYPNYLKRVAGILRIVQLLVGVTVCAAVNAERCLSSSITTIVCASASSPLWYGVLGGQGYVLFVAIIFILGNFALIFYHICTRPRTTTTTTAGTSRSALGDKFQLAELGYDVLALIMYIIAASVESWYASWLTLPVNWAMMTAVSTQYVRNVYRPQWIAAAVFAWINVILYAVSIVYNFLFRKKPVV